MAEGEEGSGANRDCEGAVQSGQGMNTTSILDGMSYAGTRHGMGSEEQGHGKANGSIDTVLTPGQQRTHKSVVSGRTSTRAVIDLLAMANDTTRCPTSPSVMVEPRGGCDDAGGDCEMRGHAHDQPVTEVPRSSTLNPKSLTLNPKP
jgi:hypothetical protein